MFTRCPNCDTTFRVTPTQLKARAGTVRCGQCHFVFNALDTLANIPTDFVESEPAAADSEQPFAAREDELLTDWGPLEGEQKSEPLEETLEPTTAQERYAPDEFASRETAPAMDAADALPNVEFRDEMREAATPDEAEDEKPPMSASAQPSSSVRDYLASPILHEPASATGRWPWVFGRVLGLVLLTVQLTYYYPV